MSGPLASWVGEHSNASWRGRAVLIQYALAAHHDGTPAGDTSRDDLERRTGLPRTTLGRGLREVRDQLGELVLKEPGGGRGRPSRYRIPVALCPAEAGCWSCSILADLIGKGVPSGPLSEGKEAGRKGSARGRKGSRNERKGSPQDPTTDNGVTATPSGGAVTPPESARSAVADTTAARGTAHTTAASPEQRAAWIRRAASRGASVEDLAGNGIPREEVLAALATAKDTA